jgi:predicted nucleic acid-binding protein
LGPQKNAPPPFVKIILDTGAWSEFFRRSQRPPTPIAQEVARLIRADVIQMLGPIRQEILSGVRPDNRFTQLRDYLRFFTNLPLDEQDDELAADFYNTCRNRGFQGTGTDLLMCAVAVRHKMKIFTLDNDFANYATCLPIRLHQLGGRVH